MKNVSMEFKQKMDTNTKFYQTAIISFSDGRTKNLAKKDFYISGNSYTDGAGTTSFPLGVSMAKQITLVLVNDDDRFSDYDFYMAKITVFCNFALPSTTESIRFGSFTVTTPESYGTQVTVNAIDDMYLGDIPYSTNLSYPMSVREAFVDSCFSCNVAIHPSSVRFSNDDYIISEMPENITHRQFWGMCAMMAGGNARMDEFNRLQIVEYDFSYFEKSGLDGGKFDANTPYASGDNADGGLFNPWNAGYDFDGGDFGDLNLYHMFYKIKTPTIETDDVVITGIQTTIDEKTYLFGNGGYVLNIENQLISGNPQEAVNRIGALLVGIRFRPFSIDHTAYPLAEFGDICYVADRKGNVYQSVITDIGFQFFGYTSIKCAADSPIRNSSQYYSESTEAIVEARKNTKKQLTEYDKAVQLLTSLITQSFGVFKTEEVLEDGSTIFYLHDKPTLSESQKIWKMTAEAFAVSSDGGNTWNAGLDASGNAVVNVLSAIGINFDWAYGGTLTLGGYGNKNGKLTILDDSGNQVGYIDNTGVNFNAGTFSGELSAATGSFSGNLSGSTIDNGNGTFSVDQNGNLVSKNATIYGKIYGLEGLNLYNSATGTHRTVIKVENMDVPESRRIVFNKPVPGSGSFLVVDEQAGVYFTETIKFESIELSGNIRLRGNSEKGITAYGPDLEEAHYILGYNPSTKTTHIGMPKKNSGGGAVDTTTAIRGNKITLSGTEIKIDSSGYVVSSDERLKNSFKPLDEFDDVYMEINPFAYKYNNGTSGRYHFGVGAKNVKDSFEKHGYTTQDFGLFVQMSDNPDNEDYCGLDDPMGIIYTEFTAWNMRKNQMQQEEINSLKHKQEKQQKEIEILKNKVDLLMRISVNGE